MLRTCKKSLAAFSRRKRCVKLLLVAGARPNFMKIAPLVKAIRSHKLRGSSDPRIDYVLLHTGQHYDAKMSAIFFNELGIPAPNFNLEVGSGTHAQQTALIMLAFEKICLKTAPDWVVVPGDVNSTLACSLVAAKLGFKVAHVEAGLRSFDRKMPEEINRLVTDALANLLLTPSRDADENLRKEGIPKNKIRFVGNIMIDTLIENLGRAAKSNISKQLGLAPNNFVYVTLHRPSNVDDPDSLEEIMNQLDRLSVQMPVVFPVHPRTCKMLNLRARSIVKSRSLKLIEPIGYHDSLWLTKNSAFVLTDSGGLQEESTYFGTPCLTLRPNTERPITIKVGTNKLSSIDSLDEDIEGILSGRHHRGRIPKYWDGHTAERILKVLLEKS